ncbi:hypothetical protein [Chthonobacter albigriseus]|uniref:hypothetical protein n=1 Tax=Chthonobacter albigriseus TaxID=1683161 RepID=UPI0015EFC525|nr:hypothetical protein [Chthonobacter albigriseus]
MWFGLKHTAAAALALAIAMPAAQAGQVLISNDTPAPITCTADGYTIATGFPFDWQIQVPANGGFQLGPRTAAPLNWVSCAGLTTRMMGVTPTGPDVHFRYSGTQQRVLNVALYNYLPTYPTNNFGPMVSAIVRGFQAAHPDILLSAVLDPNLNIYSESELSRLLASGGFDVMEVDMLYLSYLVDNNLVSPTVVDPNAVWPAALAAVTYKGQTWATPSWLCQDFLFGFDKGLAAVTSLAGLLSYSATLPPGRPVLFADFNGSWRIPAIYLNTVGQDEGYAAVPAAVTPPVHPQEIGDLGSLTALCLNGSANPCIDGSFHKLGGDQIAARFAAGNSSLYMGFSEQSFYIGLFGGDWTKLFLVPATWGAQPVTQLYTDAFVTSATNCAGAACALDAAAFRAYMTSDPVKTLIAFSQDLPAGTPPRHLLVPTRSFYKLPQVIQDPIYAQVLPVVSSQPAFLNTIQSGLQTKLSVAVCDALIVAQPAFHCTHSTMTAALPKPDRLLRQAHD